MPISALPEATVRRLRATLVIASPLVVLKELLDNAIDSGATSIDVIVSPNTVDRIEVRDNGGGVDPDDFDSLGRPGHTSKLRCFDELGRVGATSLGFRGAALASINALADVSLTTRVSTEHVATVLSLAKGGGINTRRHVAAPVGTTVCVTSLFAHLPVRLRVAVKEAPQTLMKMKDLLQCFALARPWIRLRFTVPRTSQPSWYYSPSPRDDLKTAAMQLFGTDLASQCMSKVSLCGTGRAEAQDSSIVNGAGRSSQHGVGIVFEAFLPRPGADPQKIGKGAFFSVNSRPISPARGTAKKLTSVFKHRLGDHLSRVQGGDIPRDPFIRVNIRCPPGSYDVNIEPSKEDVLFEDESLVLQQFECFLSSIYSDYEYSQPLLQSVATLMAGVEGPQGVTREQSSPRARPQAAASPVWRVDMSSGIDGMSEDGGDGGAAGPLQEQRQRTPENMWEPSEGDHADGGGGESLKAGLNPWTIAKLTSTGRRPLADRPVNEGGQQPQPRLTEDHPTNGSADDALETPRFVRPALELQPCHHGRLVNMASQGRPLRNLLGLAPLEGDAPSTQQSKGRGRGRARHHSGIRSPPTSSPVGDRVEIATRTKERPHPQYGTGPNRLVQSQVSFDRSNRRTRRGDKDDLDVDQQIRGPIDQSRRTTALASLRPQHMGVTSHLLADPNRVHRGPGLEVGQYHHHLPSSVPDAARATPAEALQQDESNEETVKPRLPIHDPRSHLIEQQRLKTQHPRKKLKRMKTDQLPLEIIPRESQTCALVLTVATDACRLAQLVEQAAEFDGWVVDGELRNAFEDGAFPEDSAVFVEALLSRAAH